MNDFIIFCTLYVSCNNMYSIRFYMVYSILCSIASVTKHNTQQTMLQAQYTVVLLETSNFKAVVNQWHVLPVCMCNIQTQDVISCHA